MEVIIGDSSRTVPAYAAREAAAGRDLHACDVVFVDGDHSEKGAYADLVNLQALVTRQVSGQRNQEKAFVVRSEATQYGSRRLVWRDYYSSVYLIFEIEILGNKACAFCRSAAL